MNTHVDTCTSLNYANITYTQTRTHVQNDVCFMIISLFLDNTM